MDLLQRLNDREIPVCVFFNRINRQRSVSRFFGMISRLGDGPVWYAMALILPLIAGMSSLKVIAHMAVVCTPTILLYKWLKRSTGRVRPYAYDSHILRNVAALDQFSFPSGHTMHAVSFSTVILYHYPEWSWFFIPFTLLIALSRVILGLHYPSDVIIGAILGYAISALSIAGLGHWLSVPV